VRGLALLARHIDFELAPARDDRHQPGLRRTRNAADAHVEDSEQAGLLPHGPFRRLSGKRMAGTAAIVGQVHPPVEGRLDHRQGLACIHPAVVDAVRQGDEVACEPVAADMGRLPHPFVVDELAHGVVERPAVDGAAAVVLAVRADEEEGVLDRGSGARHVELEQIVVALELDPPQLSTCLFRARKEREQAVLRAPLPAPDEERPPVGKRDTQLA
jgi:hypothetical protein